MLKGRRLTRKYMSFKKILISMLLLMAACLPGLAQLTIANPSLPQATEGALYSYTFTAVGGSAPYSFLPVGNLPGGLGLSTSGTLSGTPSAAGTYSFSIQVTDSSSPNQQVITVPVTLVVVNSSGLQIGSVSLPPGQVGQGYSATLAASGGVQPYLWDLQPGSGFLPNGLSITSNGNILGTPNVAGTYSFVVRVRDNGGNGSTALANFTIQVNSNTLTVATTSLPVAFVGAFYSQQVVITGGVQPYTISLLSGALPGGLNFGSSGLVSGTPTATGTGTFTVGVVDALGRSAQRQLSVTVAPAQFTLNQTPLPTGQIHAAYSASFSATGGTAPYIFTLLAGVLPTGITFNNGTLSGTPTVSGIFPITVQVQDALNNTRSANFSLVVNSATLVLSTTGLGSAVLNQPYTGVVTASGGVMPYSFTLVAGALPTGLNLAPNGTINGTPTQSGNFSFSIRVTDAAGAVTQSLFNLTVNSSSLAFTSTALPTARVNQTYTGALAITGGTSPYLISVTGGQLPPGLQLGATGTISGTPTLAGSYQVTFRVQDALNNTAQVTITIQVDAFGLRITTPTLPSARLGQYYSTQLNSEGGATPYVYFLQSGQIPPGLNLGFNGVFSGTPNTAGNFSFTVRVIDSSNQSAEANFNIAVNSSNITLTNATLPAGALNQPYSFALGVTGGTGSYTYTVISGNVPNGLGVSSAGLISGTPTVSGTYAFAVRVTDSSSASAIFNLSLVVTGAPVTITTTTLPNGVSGVAYTATIAAAGGTAPYTFAVNGGSLPAGLTLAQNGLLTGTPTLNGPYTFQVRVTDAIGGVATATFAVTITGVAPLTITTTELPAAQIGQSYTAQLAVTGGVAPYQLSLIGGSLPPGLTLLSGGTITGTPTQLGNFSFIVRVVDNFGSASNTSLTIAVNATGLTITTSALPAAQLGQFYQAQLAAAGGTGTNTWSVAGGNLPLGITLSSGGLLSGLPTNGGSFEVLFRVTDSAGLTATRTLTLAVGSNILGFLTTSLPQAYIGQVYSAQLQVGGGASPYTFTVLSGTLPAGLSLSPFSGQITGTPVASSFASITFRVTDATGASAQVTLSLSVGQSTLQFTTAALLNASLNQAYSFPIQVSGGLSPYTYTITSGTVPNGLNLNPSTGLLTGTPTQAGLYSFVVRVQDSASATVVRNFEITVLNSSFRITTTSLPNGRVNAPYLQVIETQGGLSPVRLEIASTLVSGFPPPGLVLSQNGTLQGTPTTLGNYTFTVRATDAQNLAVQANYTITIQPPAPVITQTSLPQGAVGQAYQQTFSATGGSGSGFTYSLVTGVLPPGISLAPNGSLAGNPTQAGNFTFTVRVSDSAQQNSDATFTLVIAQAAQPLSVSALAPPPGVLYFPYNFNLSATGGREPYVWSLVSGPLPNGLRIDSTGGINGLLLAPGTYRFTVRVSDSIGGVADAVLAVTVADATRLANAQVSTSYNQVVPAPATGRTPFTYSVNANALGNVPDGLTLGADGRLTGVPTTPGSYTFGVLIRDASGFTTNAAVALVVTPVTAIRIATASLPGGTAGVAYSQTLTVDGGRAPYNWVIVNGSIPNGLVLNPVSGQITGTPTLPGTGFFTVRVTDAAGGTATAYYGISVGVAGSPQINAVTSAASYAANGVAPGELLTIFGGTLGPATLTTFSLVNNVVPTQLANTRVLFDGVAVPVIYTQAGQASVIAPFSLEGKTVTRVVVEYLGFQSTPLVLPVLSSKPALFTVDASGEGAGAILNENSSVNSTSNRAARESVVVLYMTGGGAMNPAGLEGRVAAGTSSLTQLVQVTINGSPATILYAGNAPGLVEGVVQINVRLPFNTTSGLNPIRVQVGPNLTTTNVGVWVQ